MLKQLNVPSRYRHHTCYMIATVDMSGDLGFREGTSVAIKVIQVSLWRGYLNCEAW